MRLIDADALIEEIDNQMKELQKDGNDDLARGVTLFIAEKMKSFIKAQPTAYDVEKVVSELEEEREYSYADFEEYAESYGLDLSEHDDWYYQGLKRAITLAKRGIVK